MQTTFEKLNRKYLKIRDFFGAGMWRIQRKNLTGLKGVFLNLLRIFVLTLRNFQKDNCVLRASALTFYTFLSIVPVLALAFGVSKGFGFEPFLERFLIDRFLFNEEALTQIITFAQELLEKTKGGVIAGVGVAVLFWTVIKVLGHIELSLNQIWKVERVRSMGRKFNDYFAFMMICPVVIVLHGSLSVFITVQVETIIQKFELIGMFSPIIFLLLKLLPYAVIWIILTYIYKSIPYTHVKILSAAVAGVFAGTIFQLAQWAYIYFQVGVAQYNAIYGSFAAIPLFMAWLQLSWLIVLFGAEFSYAFQNVNHYEYGTDSDNISFSQKKLLYLTIARLLTKNFADEKPALSDQEISEHLGIPVIFIKNALQEMIEAGVVSNAKSPVEDKRVFQPAKDIRLYSVNYILSSMETRGKNITFIEKNPEIQFMEKSLHKLEQILHHSPANLNLKDI